ncbi:diguanylate cyclase [Pseudomarimonas salicorniae]|uniref:diguanylate cyclase n=1 Tax=Pseudomarimonas salicorniae TaxID=2933270 RepID=A0ABT0GE81_9GAMM|nr:diguanylate cyclase [Lysobacter sp. CAU 1642]MCK7592853.1 GGDEF domain-containing protein [Lysobacter sp. CAU 1642]
MIRFRVTLLIALCALIAAPSLFAAARIELARLDASMDLAEVLQQDGAFEAVSDDRIVLEPQQGSRYWLRIEPMQEPGRTQVLRLDRVPVSRLVAWYDPLPGEAPGELIDSFLAPPSGEPLRSDFSLPLRDARRILVAIDPLLPATVSWSLGGEREALIASRGAGNLAAASYAAIFATALVSLALTLAVREPAYRDFTAFAVLAGGFLALAQGHAFELPLLGPLLGAWGIGVLWMAAALCAASALSAAQGLLGLSGRAPALVRVARALVWTLAGFGLLLGILPATVHAQFAPAASAVLSAGLLLPVLATGWGWAHGARPAAAQCLMWAVFWLAATSQLALLSGWLADSGGLAWLQQGGTALAVLGLSIALTDRVIALRQRAEAMQALHASSSAVLRIEQKRRELVETLEASTGTAVEPSDLEWRAFRQLLVVLPDVLPLRAQALTVSGYRGFDYLLAEPMKEKPRICALLADRSSTLKGICRARTAMSLPPEGADPAGPRLGVVPLPVPRPGWGALLLERQEGAFATEELELAGEFAELAFKAVEQGARAVELKRRAETDPLSGMLNHRAGEELLDSQLRAARHAGEPLGVLFLDVDLLRTVNERFGMAVGDHFLRSLGGNLRPLLRDDDLMYRHGGDEFVIVLPGLGIEQSEAVAERMRAQVASQRFRSEQGPIKITVSLGVAALQPGDESARRLVERAARATEMAKGQGRNQVARAKGFGASAEAPDAPPIF